MLFDSLRKFAIAALGLALFCSSPVPAEDSVSSGAVSSADKTIIVYFSRAGENYKVGIVERGNTELMAEMIAPKTGARTFRIEPVKAYSENYKECTEQANEELQNRSRPEIKKDIELESYTTIFLGYPIWWGDMPMPVYTFLEKHDFAGKTIIPFNTHEGSGQGVTVQRLKETTKADVLDGIAVRGSDVRNNPASTAANINAWLNKLGYK